MLTPAPNVGPARKQRKGGTALSWSSVASQTADTSLSGKATSLSDKTLLGCAKAPLRHDDDSCVGGPK